MPKFKFHVLCSEHTFCPSVREEMRRLHYTHVEPYNRTLKGDHTAEKVISSEDELDNEIESLRKSLGDKIRRVSVIEIA